MSWFATAPSFVRTPRPLDPPQPVELSTEQRAVVHMCASLLLDYPDEDGGFDQRLREQQEQIFEIIWAKIF